MMKRIIPLMLVLALALALTACGVARDAKNAVESMTPTMEPSMAPAETDAMTSAMPDASANPGDNGSFPHPDDTGEDEALSTRSVLDAIAAVGEDSAMTAYGAAATVLNFCKQGGPAEKNFTDEVKDYFRNMSAEQRAAFAAGYEKVVTLAQSIAKGDVEQSELERNLTEAGVRLEVFDPVNFEHDNLVTFAEAVLAQTQNA